MYWASITNFTYRIHCNIALRLLTLPRTFFMFGTTIPTLLVIVRATATLATLLAFLPTLASLLLALLTAAAAAAAAVVSSTIMTVLPAFFAPATTTFLLGLLRIG